MNGMLLWKMLMVRRCAVVPLLDFNISNKLEMKSRKACVSHKKVVPLYRQSETTKWCT